MVDTYGGVGRHGGGAFSGKDATKVDRSGAYAARWAAKNMVAAGAARRFELQIAYAIGVAVPVAVYVDTFGTGIRPDEELAKAVKEVFDLRPRAIIERLGLEESDLSSHGGLRALRTGIPKTGHGGRRTRDGGRALHLGEDRPGGERSGTDLGLVNQGRFGVLVEASEDSSRQACSDRGDPCHSSRGIRRVGRGQGKEPGVGPRQ